MSEINSMRVSEELYRILLDSISNGIYLFDDEWQYLLVNDAGARMLGMKKEHLLGKSMVDLFPGVEETRFFKLFKQVMVTHQAGTVSDKFIYSDGREGWYEDNVYPVPEGILCIVTDITERKKVQEEKIFRITKEWRDTFNAISNLAFILDKDFRFVRVNKAFCDVMKKESKELIGKHCFEVVHNRDEPWPSCPYNKSLRTKKAIIEEIYDPNIGLPLLITTSPLFDNKGEVTGCVHIAQDISERKKAEEILRASEEKYRNLIEKIPDVIYSLDVKGNITSINKASENLLGLPPNKLIGRNITEFIQKERSPKTLKFLEKILSLENISAEVVMYNNDGKLRNVKFNSVTMIEAGKIVGVQGIITDITKLKKAQEQAQKKAIIEVTIKEAEKKKLEKILDNMLDGVTICDMNGYITYINEATIKQHGYTREECLGKTPAELFIDKKDISKFFEAITTMFSGESLNNQEYLSVRKDGTRFLTSVNISPLPDLEGKTIGVIAVHRDITEFKRMEEQLLLSERLIAIGKLASIIGHELRNPLGVINNSSYFLNMKLKNIADEKVLKHLKIITKKVNSANIIISDLLDFAKKRKLTLKETNINFIIKNAISSVIIPEKIEVITKLEEIPLTLLDGEQIQRVFQNMILNAVQAMPEGGKLTIKTVKHENSVKIVIKDTGIGIPEENISKLFNPLFSTKVKGVGLGLTICMQIVEDHGGNITVQSEVSKGSVFTVKIPLRDNGNEMLVKNMISPILPKMGM